MTETGIELAAPTIGGRVSVLAWSGLESACRQILSLLFFLGTIRFLSPADLGVFSLGVALMGIFAIVIDEPIGEALVQKHMVTSSDWNTGYTVNIGIATVCLVFACAASPLLAGFLHQPLLMMVIPALAVSSAAGAMGNIHKSFLGRSLKFRTIAQIALMAQLLAGIGSVGAAAAGLGYWALVVNVLGGALLTSLVFRFVAPWKPQFRVNAETVRSRQQYVGYSIAIRSIYLLRDQSLFVVVGALGDLKAVGYLSLAMRIARGLGQLFEEVTSRPLISLISRQQNDLARFGDVLQTVLLIIGLVAFPSFIGLAELGTPVISSLVGAQWAPAGQFLPWICAGLSGWLFLHIITVALRARGLGRLAVCLTAPAVFADVVIFFSAVWIGLDWALKIWAIRALLTLPVLISVLSARLGVSVRSLAQTWGAPLTASVLMLLFLHWLEESQLPANSPLSLLALVTAGAIIYGIALFALCPRRLRNKILRGTHWR
jgi:O-antigen/teichoic acid export membrane protein